MLIATGNLTPQSLAEQVAIVTGAGGGIGYEAARALLWLGAKVVVAEINRHSGKQAARKLNAEFGPGVALYVHTDVGDERSVENLKRRSLRRFGKVDIVINNATLAPLGAVKDVPIGDWDASYRVNLRGPVLLARAFVPGMVRSQSATGERGQGVFVCVSSLGQQYMAAYEALKAAQVQLGSTLAAELEGTGVVAFTIGPGYVPTQTAERSIPRLAAMMGKSADELFAIVSEHKISVEAAGAGFAAAVVLAERYHGQEIGSAQALFDAGISLKDAEQTTVQPVLTPDEFAQALELCRRVRATLAEQSAGWKERSVFEQQWLIRAFRGRAGMPVEQWLEALERLEKALETQDSAGMAAIHVPLRALASYYAYLHDMGKGYINDPIQREEHLAIVRGWQEDAQRLGMWLGR